MKRKMAILRYLLYGILFLPAAYVLCGVTSWLGYAAVSGPNGWIGWIAFLLFFLTAVVAGLAIGVLIGIHQKEEAGIYPKAEGNEDEWNASDITLTVACVITLILLVIISAQFLSLFHPNPDLRNEAGAFFGCILGIALILLGVSCGLIIVENAGNAFVDALEGVTKFRLSAMLSLALSVTLSGVLNFRYLLSLGGSPGETELAALIDLAVMERLDAFAALGGLVMFALLARFDYDTRLSGFCKYPDDRELLIRMATGAPKWITRQTALNLLPYPQERETIEAALNDKKALVREAAVNRLPSLEERETLARIAQNDREDAVVRAAAAKRLPYPEERETIIRIIKNGGFAFVCLAALNRLPYPEERETIAQIARASMSVNSIVRLAALNRLPYPEEREVLVQIVSQHTWGDYVDVGLAARSRLTRPEERTTLAWLVRKRSQEAVSLPPYPEEREKIIRIAKYGGNSKRLAALNLLPYPQERETIIYMAKAGYGSWLGWTVRAAATNRLPYPEERETLEWIAENDDSNFVREVAQAALKKRKRETIARMAMYDESEYGQCYRAALSLLPYPEERETIARIALNGAWYARRAALSRLSYPEEREILMRLALRDANPEVRKAAVERLPYPEEREILERIARNDRVYEVLYAAWAKVEGGGAL